MDTTKVDFSKQIASYRALHGQFSLVTVPPMSFLMVDGLGDPNTSPAYAAALATLYPVAYKLKFASKLELGRDYKVMPLEALWTADDMASFTTARDKSRWSWTLMNMVPAWITREHFEMARDALERTRTPPRLDAIRFEEFDEGLSTQTLHIGPYDDEGPVIAAMHTEVVNATGARLVGRHHEIYLTDPRRTASERLRTILRQPVEVAD